MTDEPVIQWKNIKPHYYADECQTKYSTKCHVRKEISESNQFSCKSISIVETSPPPPPSLFLSLFHSYFHRKYFDKLRGAKNILPNSLFNIILVVMLRAISNHFQAQRCRTFPKQNMQKAKHRIMKFDKFNMNARLWCVDRRRKCKAVDDSTLFQHTISNAKKVVTSSS